MHTLKLHLKTLLCLQGKDNGRRFLVISLVCYLLLLIFSPVLNRSLILLLLLLLVCCPLLLTASIRRVRDSGFGLMLAGLPVIVFCANVFALGFTSGFAKWLLLIVAVLSSGFIATLSNARIRRNYSYSFGYSGPVDRQLNETQITSLQTPRVEPTFSAATNTHTASAEQNFPAVDKSSDTSAMRKVEFSDPFEKSANQRKALLQWDIYFNKSCQWVLSNPVPASLITLAISGLIILLMVFAKNDQTNQQTASSEQQTKTDLPRHIVAKQRTNKIQMPDNFWLLTDQYQALTIAWQGDFVDKKQLWFAVTGQGEKNCAELVFDKQKRFKVMQVEVKNGGDYYADFSPLDTQQIIQFIAQLNQFELCGFYFSLQGTQKQLMSNKHYAGYLD